MTLSNDIAKILEMDKLWAEKRKGDNYGSVYDHVQALLALDTEKAREVPHMVSIIRSLLSEIRMASYVLEGILPGGGKDYSHVRGAIDRLKPLTEIDDGKA